MTNDELNQKAQDILTLLNADSNAHQWEELIKVLEDIHQSVYEEGYDACSRDMMHV